MNKIIVSVVVLVIFSLSMVSCGSEKKQVALNENTVDSLYKAHPDSVPVIIFHGKKALEEYNYELALSDGAKAFRLDSTNVEARILYARALNNREKRNVSQILEAQRLFKYVVQRQPKNKEVLVEYAATFGQMGDFEKAFKIVNQALRLDKRYREAYVLKGSLYLKLNNRKLAKSSYETAIQQDPKFYEGYLFLGSLYEEDRDSICLQYYLTAVQLRPNSIDAKYALNYAYQHFNHQKDAKAGYREMIKMDPKFEESYFQLGWMKQFQENDLDSASYFYLEAIEVEPRFPEAWYNLGLCYKDKKDKSNALRCFSNALKYNPDFYIAKEEADKLK